MSAVLLAWVLFLAAPATPAPGGTAANAPASAEPQTETAPAEAAASPEDPAPVASCLESDFAEGPARKGVQKRVFLKKWRAELAPVGGLYASDVVSTTWIAGGALSFFVAEGLGVEFLFTRTPVEFRLEEPFSGFDQDERFAKGAAWQGIASVVFAPIHAKVRTDEDSIVPADVVFTLGGGRTEHESVQGLTFAAGAGLRLYLARFISLRLDVRDFVMAQEVLGRGRITHNVGVMLGFGVWSP